MFKYLSNVSSVAFFARPTDEKSDPKIGQMYLVEKESRDYSHERCSRSS
jgi:hypothetical protein